MGEHATAIPHDLLDAFQVAGRVTTVARLSGGHIHRTLRIVTDADDVVAQAINHHVFRDLDACEDNLARLDRHFASPAAPIAIPPLRRTPDGRVQWTDAHGTAWRVSTYASGTTAGTIVTDAAVAHEAARAFGAFVQHLASLPAPPLRPTIPGFHDLPGRAQTFRAHVAADRLGRLAGCRDVVAAATALLDEPTVTASLDALPTSAVHNDAKVANLRFDGSGCAVAVVDLDTTMPGSALFDVGELLRSGTSDAAEDVEDPSEIAIDDERVVAIVEGFRAGAGDAIDAGTRALLGISGARLALENAIRFLGDHLDGDRYFAIAREGHNLVRARAGLQVARLLLDRRALIDRTARIT